MSVPLSTLVARRRVAEVDEWIDRDGRAFVPLDEVQAHGAVRRLVEEEGVESLAICLLRSFRKPAHERRVAAPTIPRCTSPARRSCSPSSASTSA
jgi:N-methylhydantoinase A